VDILCRSCRAKIHTAWIVWAPAGAVTCGASTCVSWARAGGWHEQARGLVDVRRGPMRPRGRPRCDYCGHERPALRHCFRDDGQVFCTLTCRQRAARVGA